MAARPFSEIARAQFTRAFGPPVHEDDDMMVFASPARVMSQTPERSVVIPCLNEGSHLARSLATLRGVLDGLALAYELVLGRRRLERRHLGGAASAPPASAATCAPCASRAASARSSRSPRASSTRAAQAVLVMDAGPAAPARTLVPAMVRAWREERYDVVEAIETKRGTEPCSRAARARLFYPLFRCSRASTSRAPPTSSCIDRRVLDAWARMGSATSSSAACRPGSASAARPSPSRWRRARRKSGWSPWRLLRLAVNGITSFSSAPIHLITAHGAACSSCSRSCSGCRRSTTSSTGARRPGFTTVIVLVLLVGSLTLIGIGVIGLYVARIYDEVKGRPRYVIREQTSPR